MSTTPTATPTANGDPQPHNPQANAGDDNVQRLPGEPRLSESQLAQYRQRLVENPHIAQDVVTLARMTEIWCADHHNDTDREPYDSVAVRAGVFPARKLPRLCPECAAHARYGEYRRVMCPKDPKPSCRSCDIHCYSAQESDWQRQSMAYAGPRAMFRGLAREAFQHLRQEVFVARTQDANKRARRDAGRGQKY